MAELDGEKVSKNAMEARIKAETEQYGRNVRLECLKLVLAYGKDVDKSEPWNRANLLYTYVMYGKAMSVS